MSKSTAGDMVTPVGYPAVHFHKRSGVSARGGCLRRLQPTSPVATRALGGNPSRCSRHREPAPLSATCSGYNRSKLRKPEQLQPRTADTTLIGVPSVLRGVHTPCTVAAATATGVTASAGTVVPSSQLSPPPSSAVQTTPSAVVNRITSYSGDPVKVVAGAVVVVGAVVAVVGAALVVVVAVGLALVVAASSTVVVDDGPAVVVGAAVVVELAPVVAVADVVDVATPALVEVGGAAVVDCSTFAERAAAPVGATAAEVSADAPGPHVASTRTTENDAETAPSSRLTVPLTIRREDATSAIDVSLRMVAETPPLVTVLVEPGGGMSAV
ncbi:hypothetical protein [Rhodococcoides kroppenstedtii]|uniref:hypothetical protein n=1 Tax=Rhodococcoides kroppenstedtii TaxID=293050 RepID=UPI0028F03160|nr:hypothetical protein [Rhodococcus kroppenstedtii]